MPKRTGEYETISDSVDEADDFSGSSINSSSHERPPLPLWRLISMTLALAGCQFGWSIQIGYSTSTFLTLGMPDTIVSYAWLAGPISGMVVQPLVGAISDRCTLSLGRRRPFIIAGVCCIILSLAVFSYSDMIGYLLGDHGGHHPAGLAFAVLGFWILDFSINTLQGPCRILLADIAPPSQQKAVNASFGFMASLGNLSGNLIGSANLLMVFPFFAFGILGEVRALYFVGMVAITVTTIVCLVASKELPPPPRPHTVAKSTCNDRVLEVIRSLKQLPVPVRRVFVVQLFTWFAWFTTFMFATTWVGATVYGGDPTAAAHSDARRRFEAGVRVGNFGLALQAAVSMAYAPILPWLLRRIGTRPMYFVSQCLQAAALLTMLFVGAAGIGGHRGGLAGDAAAVVPLAVMGITWATTMTVPWEISCVAVAETTDVGLFLATMNLSQCLPEIVASFAGTAILSLSANNYGAVLGAGGVAALIGAVLVLVLVRERTPRDKDDVSTGMLLGGH